MSLKDRRQTEISVANISKTVPLTAIAIVTSINWKPYYTKSINIKGNINRFNAVPYIVLTVPITENYIALPALKSDNTFLQRLVTEFAVSNKKTSSVAAGFGRHGMPRPPLMTQIQHFVSRITNNNNKQTLQNAQVTTTRRGRDETYRRCELVTLTSTFDLETGARVVEYPLANFGDTASIRCRFMGYWAWARVSGRGKTSSLSIDRPACCLDGGIAKK